MRLLHLLSKNSPMPTHYFQARLLMTHLLTDHYPPTHLLTDTIYLPAYLPTYLLTYLPTYLLTSQFRACLLKGFQNFIDSNKSSINIFDEL